MASTREDAEATAAIMQQSSVDNQEETNNDTSSTVTCKGCRVVFPSRNAVFKHLKATKATCLSSEDFKHYLEFVQSRERVKTVLLIGYLTDDDKLNHGNDITNFLLDILFQDNDKDKKFNNRSYGNDKRNVEVTRQDEGTGALTEVLCVKMAPLMQQSVDDWIEETNQKIVTANKKAQIRILGRHDLPQQKFNAEMDVSHRRVEYILPVDILYNAASNSKTREQFEASFPAFSASPFASKFIVRPDAQSLTYLHWLKKMMQLMCSQIVDLDISDAAMVMEKEFSDKKRKRQQRRSTPKRKTKKVLRRRRFHNFTPRVMAHEYLAFRRLDRFYHRATMIEGGKVFFNLSLTGDIFLHGQVVRVVGLLIAIVRGMIDEDIVECIFDEAYPHLVPTPPAPTFPLVAGDASYMNWEGKSKLILSPRRTDQYDSGFNEEKVLDRVAEWEEFVHQKKLKEWLKDGLEPDGRLKAEKVWIEQVLEPWAVQARLQLEDYRQWKSTLEEGTIPAPAVSLESIDTNVPQAYEKVLHYLRKADQSERWPTTTPKRQLVMISTKTDDKDETPVSLAMAHIRAKTNKEERNSAYAFEEGQGGASGSFSVGAFPGDAQPKANEIFPELMKAAFELERVLMPDREPSSTIAINRNAQFRPHTDSGAGAGQSLSLIVGLGNYSGGELVVEGEQKDIRYKALEFNGWTQRHWTMPFQGERYSLVWFTPKGCEGIHGIDL